MSATTRIETAAPDTTEGVRRTTAAGLPAGAMSNTDRRHVDTSRTTPTNDSVSPSAAIERREALFAEIRLSRTLNVTDPDGLGAVVGFPMVVFVDGQPVDLEATAYPGWFAEGHHVVHVQAELGDYDVSGRFEIAVGQSFGVLPALWLARHRLTDRYTDVPAHLAAQLPTSLEVPARPYIGAARRTHLAAERARAELLEANRGLLVSVVKRFRGVARTESAIIETSDLMVVAEQQLLDVVDRWFTDPEEAPLRSVAFSKVVQRAVGNAVRSEIARATGISVEFRHLLGWFNAHPDDRDLPAEQIAARMAFEAGVTRVMSAHGLRSRSQAADLLRGMLDRGEACYVEPGRQSAARARELNAAGVLVISSRSSIAEIERARHFRGQVSLTSERDDDEVHPDARLGVLDPGLDRAETVDAVRSLITASGMTDLEAAVWILRTGVLDPTGHATELPDIATELALSGRAEARAALRRARRKLEHWATEAQRISESLLEPPSAAPTRTTPGKDVRFDITRR